MKKIMRKSEGSKGGLWNLSEDRMQKAVTTTIACSESNTL